MPREPEVTPAIPGDSSQKADLQPAGREQMNCSSLLEKPFQRRACFRSGAEDHSLDRLRDFHVVFQTRLQSLQDPVASSENKGNKRVALILCNHYGRDIAMGSKIQVYVLAPEIFPEIELSRIHWKG